MLICDLCGGKNKVESYNVSFEINRNDDKPVGTRYNRDICTDCYTKLHNMIIYNNSPALHTVLSKGLDLKPIVTRTSNRGD